MSANSTFQIVNETGWRMGFANLLRKENRDWWYTRRWWMNIIIWLLIINGIAYAMLWTPVPTSEGEFDVENIPSELPPADVAVPNALMNLVIMAGIFTPIGAVIAVQGSIIDEKKSGTAAWILSKPASRTAFIVSKLLANGVALIILTTVIQWAVLYILLSVRGSTPPLGSFALGVALLALHLLFYMSLTVMLGTIFNDRGPVIGIPIGILFAAQFLMNNLAGLAPLTPWALIFPSGMEQPVVMKAMMGMPLTTIMPIVATIVWIALFIGVALWRFRREEF